MEIIKIETTKFIIELCNLYLFDFISAFEETLPRMIGIGSVLISSVVN